MLMFSMFKHISGWANTYRTIFEDINIHLPSILVSTNHGFNAPTVFFFSCSFNSGDANELMPLDMARSEMFYHGLSKGADSDTNHFWVWV